MNNKVLLVAGISIISASILISFILLYFSNPNTSPDVIPKTTLENCSILKENSENAINLVFLSDKDNAEKYTNFLESISPFNKYSAFNVYYIPDYKPNCRLYKEIALLCYSKEIIKKASSCPHDYIIAIQEKDANIRSSEYMGVISINSAHPLSVFPHEFGHAFVNLAEEYTPAEIPRGSKNCQPKCENFNIKDSCYEGCSRNDYFRSIENGIMRTLSSSDYGLFNEQLITEKFDLRKISPISANVIFEDSSCQDQKYYLIEGQYSNNRINVIDKTIESGCLSNGGSGPFTYNLILNNAQIIPGNEFNPEFIFTDAQTENEEIISGQVYTSDLSFILKLPVISNSKILEILKENEKISEIQLSDIGARPCQI